MRIWASAVAHDELHIFVTLQPDLRRLDRMVISMLNV